MSKKAFAAPLTAQQCELIREFLGGGFEPVLLLMTAGEGQKARAEADKRNAGPDVLGLVAEIQVAGLPEGLRQAWLLGYRLKDEQRPPPQGCS